MQFFRSSSKLKYANEIITSKYEKGEKCQNLWKTEVFSVLTFIPLMFQHITKLQREKIRIWQKKRKFKKWVIFHGFFKNARVIDFDESPKDEKMIFLDQLLKKASDQGPNLTSYEFQTKWRGSDFWLTAQYVVNFQHSALVSEEFWLRTKT